MILGLPRETLRLTEIARCGHIWIDQAAQHRFVFIKTNLLRCPGTNPVAMHRHDGFVARHPVEKGVEAEQQQFIQFDVQGAGHLLNRGSGLGRQCLAEIVAGNIALQLGRPPFKRGIANDLYPEAHAFGVLNAGEAFLFPFDQQFLRQTEGFLTRVAVVSGGDRRKKWLEREAINDPRMADKNEMAACFATQQAKEVRRAAIQAKYAPPVVFDQGKCRVLIGHINHAEWVLKVGAQQNLEATVRFHAFEGKRRAALQRLSNGACKLCFVHLSLKPIDRAAVTAGVEVCQSI